VCVWIFSGENSHLPSGAFSTKERAEEWIVREGLSGVLTRYPMDESVYDWAMRSGAFRPKVDKKMSAKQIQSFSSAALEHHHYSNGRSEEEDC
jgi:hypothetical protein